MSLVVNNYFGKAQEPLSQEFFTVKSHFFPNYAIQVANSNKLDFGDCLAESRKADALCADLSLEERCEVLSAAADKFSVSESEAEHLVKMTGMPISSVKRHVIYARELLAHVPESVRLHHESFAGTLGQAIGKHGYELLLPRRGMVTAFIPPNDPAEAAFIFAHTVMSGSSIILKPSRQEPYFAVKLAELITEKGGYPAGGLNVIHWDTNDPGRAHLKHGMIYDTDSLVFMGDIATAAGMLRSNVELWNFCVFAAGKSKAIVDEGANLEAVADDLTYSSLDWTNSCVTTKAAVVVGKENAEILTRYLAERFKRMAVGSPLDAKTQIGYVEPEVLQDMEKVMRAQRDFGLVDFVLPFERIGEYQMRPMLVTAASSDPELVFFKEELPYTLAIVPVDSFGEAVNFVNRSVEHLGERSIMATSLYARAKTFREFVAQESKKYAALKRLASSMIFYNKPSLDLSPYLNHQGINLTRFLSRPLTIVEAEEKQ